MEQTTGLVQPNIYKFSLKEALQGLDTLQKAATLVALAVISTLSYLFVSYIRLSSDRVSKNSEMDPRELEFWKHCYGEMHNYLEMVMIQFNEDPKDRASIPEMLVSRYGEYKELDKETRNLLIKAVCAQLAYCNNQKDLEPQLQENNADITQTRVLDSHEQLAIYRTRGDGSCGLHALLGEAKGNQFECDATKARKEFCNWIRNQKGALPARIQSVLVDYFLYFDICPLSSNEVIKQIREELYAGYEEASDDEQDQKKKAFTSDERVFKAYLANLEKVGTYLLQDELISAAECFKKTMVLYQPGWGNDAGKTAEKTVTQGEGDPVGIFYNGTNHYERADKLT